MSKVIEVEKWITFIFTSPCQHEIPNMSAQLEPKLDMGTLSEAFAKSDKLFWCSACGKDKVAPIEPTGMVQTRRRFTRIAKLDCGHVSKAGVELDRPDLVKPLANIVVGDELSCSECSSDKAIEMEATGQVDIAAAQKRFEDQMRKRREERGDAVPMALLEHKPPTATAASADISPGAVNTDVDKMVEELKTTNPKE